MTTREEFEREIRKLNGEIETLESERRSAKTDEMKISLDARITAKTALLTAKENRLLFLEQQGKFHHIFPLSFPNLLDVTHCPITLDISSSPILVMQIRKVRVDGYYCSCVGFFSVMHAVSFVLVHAGVTLSMSYLSCVSPFFLLSFPFLPLSRRRRVPSTITFLTDLHQGHE